MFEEKYLHYFCILLILENTVLTSIIKNMFSHHVPYEFVQILSSVKNLIFFCLHFKIEKILPVCCVNAGLKKKNIKIISPYATFLLLFMCVTILLIQPIIAPTYYYFTHFPMLPWQKRWGKDEEPLTVVLDTTVFPCKIMRGAEPVGAQGYFQA